MVTSWSDLWPGHIYTVFGCSSCWLRNLQPIDMQLLSMSGGAPLNGCTVKTLRMNSTHNEYSSAPTKLVEGKFGGIMNNFQNCIMNTISRDFKGNIQFWRGKTHTKRAQSDNFLAENLLLVYFQITYWTQVHSIVLKRFLKDHNFVK